MDSLNQKIIQLHSIVTENQRRYTFLLLAVAAAAIALTLKNTESESLDWFLVPIGVAAIFWALSFYKGLRRLLLVESTLILNISWLDYERQYMQTTPEYTPNQDTIALHEKMKEDIDSENEKSIKVGTWQYYFLGLGALSYIGWHVLRLYINTYCLTS